LPRCGLWQRWPHGAAILLGLGGALLAVQPRGAGKDGALLVWLGGLALAAPARSAFSTAGVEWSSGPDLRIARGGLRARTRRFRTCFAANSFAAMRHNGACWAFPWPGYNAIFSFAGAAFAASLLRQK